MIAATCDSIFLIPYLISTMSNCIDLLVVLYQPHAARLLLQERPQATSYDVLAAVRGALVSSVSRINLVSHTSVTEYNRCTCLLRSANTSKFDNRPITPSVRLIGPGVVDIVQLLGTESTASAAIDP